MVVGEEEGVEQPVNGLASRPVSNEAIRVASDNEVDSTGQSGVDQASRREEQPSGGDRQQELAARCGKPVPRLTVLPAESLDIDDLFAAACGALVEAA